MRHASSSLPLIIAVLSVQAGVARADPAPILAGRIDRVVAVCEGVAVLRAGEVLLLDGAGHTIGRCAGEGATAGRPPRPDRTTIPAERLLRESGFREDDDSPEAEALLDDEGIEARRRRRPIDAAAGMPRALSLAAGGGGVWIGTTDGLWRLDARTASCTRAALGGRALDLVAAAAAIVVAVADATIWRSVDGGTSFTVAAVLTSRARAVALVGDATALVATDDAVVAVTASRYARPVLDRPADALVACGAHAIALGEDGVYQLDADGRAWRLGDRPAARALGCASPEGPRLWAVGVGAWSTADGQTWTEEPFLGRSIADVAFAAGRTWLALEDGLVVDGLVATPSVNVDGVSVEDPAATTRARARVARPSPPSWAWLLPRLSVSFDGFTESRARAGWRLWLVLTVTLDRRRFGRPDESSEVPQ